MAPRGLNALRRFAQATATAPAAVAPERCELCARALAAEHDHLLAPGQRALVCACGPCATLFPAGVGPLKYVRVAARVERAYANLEEEAWRAVGVPIDLAFFYRSGDRLVAGYPSPAGTTESDVSPGAWRDLAPGLTLAPEVEALLVNRLKGARAAFLVSIDRCFALAGLLRARWRGFGGGEDAWAAVADFFEELSSCSR